MCVVVLCVGVYISTGLARFFANMGFTLPNLPL